MTTEVASAVERGPEAARRRAERIRFTALSARDALEKLQRFTEEAKSADDHLELGYASWTEYLADVLGQTPLRLARDQRQELVGYLAGEGMSTRAIAPIVGVDNATVHRDLSSVANATVERPATVTSLDGRERPATQPIRVDRETGEVTDSPAPQRSYAPRTDVVRVISTALTRARDAAFQADQIKREHLKDRNDEAATWGRSLAESMESLQRLMALLTEATQ